MLIQERDGTVVHEPLLLLNGNKPSFSMDVPPSQVDHQGTLIDQLIDYAFTTLGSRYIELRVTAHDETR